MGHELPLVAITSSHPIALLMGGPTSPFLVMRGEALHHWTLSNAMEKATQP